MRSIIEIRILSTLEGGGFQKLCDMLLCAEGYKELFSFGMKEGTSKTSIGNPDTYFRGKSGKYIFVVYTTEQSGIDKKIKKDIEKCLDKEKTGINVKDIEKIICCHTSSTLKAGDDQKLRELCKSYGIELELYGINKIADKIYREYQHIAKDELNLSIDTEQILPKDEFIRQYDQSNGRTAPLATNFLYREKEKREILEALKSQKVIIILGKAGVGKTRLALEVAKEFQEENKCNLFCIKSNSLPIRDDLSRYFSAKGKFLIFVDDANELAGISHLVEYAVRDDKKHDIRIIATVRDYASKTVINEMKKLVDVKSYLVSHFTNREIRELVKSNLGINNINYIDQIVRIAGGNPRIAYMAGKLAIEKNNLQSIINMDEFYKRFYTSFPGVTDVLAKSRLSLVAGIISLFNTINLDNLDRIQAVLDIIKMTKEEFYENILLLHDMECVAILFEKAVRIDDQCLSNYLLYYVFFEKRLIKLSDLIRMGFRNHKNSVVKIVDIFLSVFYSDRMKDFLTKEIHKVWDEFKADNKIFEEFVRLFHVFNPEESLLYVNEKIEQTETVIIDINLLGYEKQKWDTNINDNILQMLVDYEKDNGLSEAVELIIHYCVKKQNTVNEVYGIFKSYYSIDRYSGDDGYYVQNIVIDKIRDYLEYPIIKKLFYRISCHYLALLFDSAEINGNIFTSYQISVFLTESVKQYRSKIWTEIASLAKCEENLEDTIYLLRNYPNRYVNKNTFSEELEFDWCNIKLILDAIRVYMEPFRFAYICSKFFRMSNKCAVELAEKYEEVFNTKEWDLYKALSGRCFGENVSYEERKAVCELNIRKCYESYDVYHMNDIVQCISNIIRVIDSQNLDIRQGIAFLCTLVAQDKEKLWAFVSAFFAFGDNIDFRPDVLVASLLKNFGCKKVQNFIWNAKFPKKKQWQFTYFAMIDSQDVAQEDYQKLMNLVAESATASEQEQFEIHLRMFDKFTKYSLNIYVDVMKVLSKSGVNNIKIIRTYFSDLFTLSCYTPEEVLDIFQDAKEELKYIYFACLEECAYIDYQGSFFSEFVLRDMDWIKQYVLYLQRRQGDYKADDEEHRMYFCWQKDNFLDIFDMYFNELLKNKPLQWYHVRCFRNTLTFDVQTEGKYRMEQWIMHYIKENADSDNLIELFHILQEMENEIRKKAVLYFLKNNSDYELFKHFGLVSNSWSGTPSLTNKIMFYEGLLPEIIGVNFLKHKKKIKAEIEKWKSYRDREEVEEIFRKLYR